MDHSLDLALHAHRDRLGLQPEAETSELDVYHQTLSVAFSVLEDHEVRCSSIMSSLEGKVYLLT